MNTLYSLGLFVCLILMTSLASANSISGFDLISGQEIVKDIGQDKVQVSIFLNSRCPCSQAHFDHLNELQKKYSQFIFIGFQVGKGVEIEEAHKYFQKYKIDFPIIFDQDFKYANDYKAVKTPHIFINDGKNKLLFQGAATDSRNPARAKEFYLRDALASLALGEEIKVTNAKTLGCYIQR